MAREFRFRLNSWTVAAVLLGLFLFLPMAEVLWHITSPAENWEHLRDTVLGRYLKGSAILVVGTAGLSLLLGVSTAWLVACCEFPGRRFFEWALILPLAIPTYIAAFAYFDLLDRLTPLLIWVRTNISPEAMTWLSDMMVYPVTTVVLAAVLYPYVYLVARAAFSRQVTHRDPGAKNAGRESRDAEVFHRAVVVERLHDHQRKTADNRRAREGQGHIPKDRLRSVAKRLRRFGEPAALPR